MSGFGVDYFGGGGFGAGANIMTSSIPTPDYSGFGSMKFGLGIFGGASNISLTSSLDNSGQRAFGSARFGLGNFGTGESPLLFNLLSAEATTRTEVLLTFNSALTSSLAVTNDTTNYSINHGAIIATAVKINAVTVQLTLLQKLAFNTVYTVTVSLNVTDAEGETLTDNTATFNIPAPGLTNARRVNKFQYFNPGFGFISDAYDDI